jgi:transcriptional regulator with XRE-family HTH domain
LRGLSIAEFAKRAGTNQRKIYQLLNGEFWPSLGMLTGISSALDCSIVDLLTITVSLSPAQAAEIHADIGAVINRHVARGWSHVAREAIAEQFFEERAPDGICGD